MALSFIVVLYTYLGLAAALSSAGWRSQSIYQLLTDRFARTDGSQTACSNLGNYCGGTWQGIINKLDYIQSMGFTAIWISPITEQIQGTTHYGDAFHGFWPQKINQVNSNFGTAADLKALSTALHQRGMYLMVDMVTNDMAWPGSHTSVDYSQFDVFNDSSLYHPFCQVSDYENSTQATECWTGDENLELPDLATENPAVVSKWQSWVSNTVQTYGIDGIRLDACLEINKEFFPPFEQAANVYVICEVYNYPINGTNGVCDYQNYVSGLLNFPIWYKLVNAFSSISGSMGNLSQGLTDVQANCKDVSLLGNFVENHDVSRFPNTVTDEGLDQNAIAFSMMNDGIPVIYAGEEQHYSGGAPPNDRETTWTSGYDTTNDYYQLIRKINLFRQCVIAKDTGYTTSKSSPFFLDTQVIALKKGSSATMQTISVFNNRGVGAVAYTINMTSTGYTPGTQVYEIVTQQTVTVTPEGYLPVYMYGGQPRIYYPLSSQCFGNTTTPVSSTATSATTATPSSTSPSTSNTIQTTSATSSSVPGSSTSTPGSTTGSGTTTAVASGSSSSPVQISSPATSTSSMISPTGPTSSQVAPSSTSASSSMSSTPSLSGPSVSPASTAPPSSGTAVPGTTSPSSSLPSSTSGPISATPLSSSTGGNPLSASPSISTGASSAAVPGTSSPSSSIHPSGPAIVTPGTPASSIPASGSLSPTISAPTVPTAARTSPVCPDADGRSFIMNGQEFSVGCGIGSDQEHFAQQPGQSISDCVSQCTTHTGASACVAVTFINNVCYLKSEPGAVHQEVGSDSAFVTVASNGQETIVSSFLSGNISHAAPVCPSANGNTFESNGYIYVVGCSIDNYAVDIYTSAGADLPSCIESCINYFGAVSCAAVTHNNGNCYLKGSVGTTFHNTGAETAFIIASPHGVNPAGLPPGAPPQGPPAPWLPPHPIGYPPPAPIGQPPPPPPNGNPPLPPHATGTYTMSSPGGVIVYMPLNETCP